MYVYNYYTIVTVKCGYVSSVLISDHTWNLRKNSSEHQLVASYVQYSSRETFIYMSIGDKKHLLASSGTREVALERSYSCARPTRTRVCSSSGHSC